MKKILIISLLFISTGVFADCPELYPSSKVLAPENTVELCNTFYVSRFDVTNKAVILTSEWLQRTKIFEAERTNYFKADTRLGDKSPLSTDYVYSGYDRGHMVAAGDASNNAEMRETFLMTNVTPQEASLNRGAWRVIEEKIRTQFFESDVDFKIVTIAIYSKPSRINSGIPVPMGFWKIVYKNEIETDFYFAENKPKSPVISYTFIEFLVKSSTLF